MQSEFSRLAEIVKQECRGGPTYFMSNRGNWGDALIRLGTKILFRQIGLQYYEMQLHKGRVFQIFERYLPLVLKGSLIYGGGGAWCKLWDRSPRILDVIASSYRKVIILPSTFELNSFLPNATYFCRDNYESKAAMPEAIFCHDMAFLIGPRPAREGKGDGSFFRIDKESAGKIPLPANNRDVSLLGTHFADPLPLFDILDAYARIHTDRLHVAIAACLLGKELHFYPGAYFKNKAVYLSSMQGYFKNVHFHELN
ncbi:MAG TPA: polysaccharide pyruvyl transferase family protein [Anaerolineales bacterium]|nr:polysaccharide pyruvyl transferase family protein [Anaerolineales bacterium]